jgi:glycosyltransferase involved in cell wall biosynthesis
MTGRVALITEIPSPYRIPVFNELDELLGGKLDVFFTAASEPRRDWPSPLGDAQFRYEILGGRQFSVPYRGDRLPIYLAPPLLLRLMRGRYETVLVGGWSHLECYWALAYAKSRRARFVLWSETPLLEAFPHRPLRGAVKRAVIGAADAYVVPGPSAGRYLQRLGADPTRIHLAPNAVDVEFWGERPPEVTRAPPQTLLYSGRLDAAKGVDLALEAFAASRLVGQAELVIAGDGPERAALEEKAVEGVRFLGAQTPESLRRLYHSADMLVFPSRYDPWGLVVNEAASARLAAIASDGAGATRDLLRDRENALVVRAGDVVALRDAMNALHDDPALARRLGAAAAAISETNSPAACAAGIDEAIGGVRQ